MKNRYSAFILAISLILYYSFSGNPPNGRTGAPGESTCGSAGCHAPSNPAFSGSINVTGLDADVLPGETYPLIITITDDNLNADRAGFQMTNVGPDDNVTVGTFSNPSSNATVTISGDRTYVEHSPATDFSGGLVTFEVDWTAPSDLVDGDVIDFYSISVIANGSGSSNDLVVTQQFNGTMNVDTPPLVAEVVNLNDPLCFDSNDGSAQVNITGGTPPYSIQWSSGETGTTATMLSGGTNSVNVTDAANESQMISFDLTTPSELVITNTVVVDVDCAGENTGSILVEAAGGTGNLSYLWSTGSTDNFIENLPAGSYEVVISDENDCSIVQVFTISAGILFNASIGVVDQFCETIVLQAFANPSIAVTYEWNTQETSPSITGFYNELYAVTLTSIEGCTAEANFTLENTNDPLSVVIEVVGMDPYTLTANPSGGFNSSYSYLWVETNETTQSITVTEAGIYTVIVTDANGCTIESSVEIEAINCMYNISETLSNPTCNGGSDGSITVDVVFETDGPVTYLWNTGDMTSTINSLTAGTYSVVFSNGDCTDSTSYVITDPEALSLNFDATNPSTDNPSSGSISVTVNNGTAPYEYLWSTQDSTAAIENLMAGTYVITVTDANNCEVIDSVELVQVECMFDLNVEINSIICVGDLATATITSNTSETLNYLWSTGDTSSSVSNLIAGKYDVIVSDENNCSETLCIEITDAAEAMITIDSIGIVSCEEEFALIDISIDWNFPPYEILWSNGDTTTTADSLLEGEISVIITNAAGCQHLDTFTIEKSIEDSPSATLEFEPIYLDENGQFNGIPSFLSTIAGSCDDSLYVVVDSIFVGCPDVLDTLEIETVFYNFETPIDTLYNDIIILDSIAPLIEVSYDQSIDTFCGFASYLLEIDFDEVSIQDNCPGTVGPDSLILFIETDVSGEYCESFTFTDAAGNTSALQLCKTIVVLEEPVVEFDVTEISCFMEMDGCIEFEIVGGTAPYEFIGDTSTCNLGAGIYNYIIQDSNGCTDSVNITLKEPDELIITEIAKQDETPGESDGFIDVDVTGGTPPYTFTWTENGVVISESEDLINFPSSQYTLSVVDANGCETILNTFIDVFSSVGESELESIVLVQNPIHNVLIIEDIPVYASVTILSIDGIQIFRDQSINNDRLSIPSIEWPSGTYICFIEKESSRKIIKIIKQ